jgi:hypothetical protein
MYGTLALTLGITAALILIAPGSGGYGAVASVVFIGSGVHVAATGWFFTVPAVRRYARANPLRYIVVPALLVLGTAVVAVVVPPNRYYLGLIPYFVWQNFHYQKQNVGMTALAGVSNQAGSATKLERQCIVVAGVAGIAGLVIHPELMGLTVQPPIRILFPVAAAVFAGAVVIGLLGLLGRERRPPAFVAMYALSLLFFAPVFIFHSPQAAATSFAVAHGYQYLLIVGLVAGSSRIGRAPIVSLGLLVAIALVGGLVLSWASHLPHLGLASRAVFGAYLGIVMSHFVIDAGLWRLRDKFPRQFLTENLPYLLAKPARAN